MENYTNIFTLEEVRKYLKLPKSTVYMLTSKNRIPHFKIGKQLRFKKTTIDKWAYELEASQNHRKNGR